MISTDRRWSVSYGQFNLRSLSFLCCYSFSGWDISAKKNFNKGYVVNIRRDLTSNSGNRIKSVPSQKVRSWFSEKETSRVSWWQPCVRIKISYKWRAIQREQLTPKMWRFRRGKRLCGSVTEKAERRTQTKLSSGLSVFSPSVLDCRRLVPSVNKVLRAPIFLHLRNFETERYTQEKHQIK